MPNMRYMTNMQNDYVDLVWWLRDTGEPIESRGLRTREQTGVTLVFPSYRRQLLPIGVGRRVNSRLAAIESLQLLGGVARSDLIRLAAPGFEGVLVAPDNPDYGAYGPRLADRLRDVVRLLTDDPASRRAVATIWEPRDLMHEGDRPCTLSLQFLIRRDKLELHVTMRSQDVWLGLTFDAFVFSQIQETLARLLEVDVGTYVHHVASMHLYDSDVYKTGTLHYNSEAGELVAQLPRGVIANRLLSETVAETAQRMMDKVFVEEDLRINPWYVEQMQRILVTAESEPTT